MLKPISNSNNIEVAWFRTYKNAKKKEIIMFVAQFNIFHVMDPTIICIICYSSLLTKGAESKSRSLHISILHSIDLTSPSCFLCLLDLRTIICTWFAFGL